MVEEGEGANGLTLHQRRPFILRDLDCRFRLAEERDNGLSRMATNDRDDSLAGIFLPGDVLYKGLCTNNV